MWGFILLCLWHKILFNEALNKYLRYTLKGFAIFIGLFILLYTAAYIYIAANKKEIILKVKEQVADKLNGDVQLGNIGLSFLSTFPNISILIEKVSIKDTLFNRHHHPFFEADKVYANISLLSVIKKITPLSGFKIENARLYVYTDTSGYTNSYLFSPKGPTQAAPKATKSEVQIDDIKLRNVRLVLDNQQKGKLFDFEVRKYNCNIKTTDTILRLKTKNDILIHSLAFNTKRGSFAREATFEGDFVIMYNKLRKKLSFTDIDVDLKNHPFTISGLFDFDKNAPKFNVKVYTKNIDYNFAKTLVDQKIDSSLSLAKLEKPVNEVTAEISGPLNGGDPLANINWKVTDNIIQSPFARFTNCSLTGSFTNELIAGLPRKDPNSRIQIHDFKGDWEGLTITSQNAYIDNLVVPIINCDIKTDFNLSELNNILESSTLDLHEGKGSVNLTYSGPLAHNSNKNTLINGKINFSDGIVHYIPRDIQLKDVNGNIVFKNTDVFVTDLRSNVLGSKIIMNGTGKNLLALIKTNPGKLFLDWNIYSPSLNLANFTSLLKKRGSTVRKSKGRSKLGSTTQNLDEIVNQANLKLDIKADELKYKRFLANNVRASLALMNENWILNNVSLQHGGGSMVINGSLNEKNNKYYGADIKVNLNNVDVNKVMYAFYNFGQNGIEARNLRGKLSSNVNVRMDIDRDLEGMPANMDGYIDFSLKKGALIDYEPLKKVQKVAFKNRNFDEIYFAELKDRFDVKNKEITINRMEIQSTVITLYVEGVYSLRGNTDISIQVPLSNLKKRDDNYKPENKGVDEGGGASVYVRGRPGDDGSIQFKLDVFRKFRKTLKEKKDDEEKGDTKTNNKPAKAEEVKKVDSSSDRH